MAYTIRPRYGTTAGYTALNRVYDAGELLCELGVDGLVRMKVADGATAYNTLPYVVGGEGSGSAPAFGTVAVPGQSNVVAESTGDTVTMIGSSGIALTTNAGTDTLTFAPEYGTTANTICQGNDSRIGQLAAHAVTHRSGGSDAIKLDALAAPDDNTSLNASTAAHGLLPKLSGVATEFVNGLGAYAVPAGSAPAETGFGIIAVDGQSPVVIDVTPDTLNLAGSGITITTNASTDTVTFAPTYGTTAGTVCQGNDVRLSALNVSLVGTFPLDSDVRREGDSTVGGFFADYDCKAANLILARSDEVQTSAIGGHRDAIFIENQDDDLTNYQSLNKQKVANAVRAVSHGPAASGAFTATYKDIVGADFHAIGNVQWSARGCSGVVTGAIQKGIGIASNEFYVENSAAAGGGTGQSTSMAAVQAIVGSNYAAADAFPGGGHGARGVLVTNIGNLITSAFEVVSAPAAGFDGHVSVGMNLGPAYIDNAGIVMGSDGASGNPGTIIQYDTGDFTKFDRASDRFEWYIGGVRRAYIDSTGFHNG